MPLVLDGTNGVSGVDGTASNPAIEGTDSNTGIFYPAADTVAIGTGGTEALRVNSSQQVGIGTSSPASKLHISGGTANTARIDGSSNGGAWAVMRNGSVTGGIYNTGAIIGDTTSGVGIFAETGLDVRFYTNGSATDKARITTGGDFVVGCTSSPFRFGISGSGGSSSADLTLDSNAGYSEIQSFNSKPLYINRQGNTVILNSTGGSTGIGTTSPGAKLAVSAGNATGFRVDTVTANESLIVTGSGSNLQVRHPAAGVELFNSGGNAFRIVANTNGVSLAVNGTSWGVISDERLKDIIEPITNASEKVASLRAVIGKYKTDEEGVRRSFLIAQDVNAVLPEAVVTSGEDDDTLLLQYTDTIPLLVAAIKELNAKVEAQAAEIAALKAQP